MPSLYAMRAVVVSITSVPGCKEGSIMSRSFRLFLTTVAAALLVFALACTGPVGTQGEVGPQGPPGKAGTDGVQGPPAEQGIAGAQGESGVHGERGAQGPQGEAGPPGAMGPKGDRGAPGLDGVRGAVGPQGPQGERGPAGPRGSQGDQGAQGGAEFQGGGGWIRWIGAPEISRGDVETTFQVMLPRSLTTRGVVLTVEDGYGAEENFSDSSTAAGYYNIEPWTATRDGQLYQVSVSPEQQIWDYTYVCVWHWSDVEEDTFVVAGCNTIGGQ